MSSVGNEDTLSTHHGHGGEGQDTLAEGQLFAGRYRVINTLGRGGMGIVLLVEDIELGEAVALKLLELPPHDDRPLQRFRREVRLARRITHRNIARTFDLGEEGHIRFLTMEYIRGEDLDAKLGRGRVAVAQAIEIGRQIANGLTAAHAAGVIHRDLKPANILLEHTSRVVITDFGVARAMSGSDATLQTGGLVGTPAYMAPEQIIGGAVDGRSDIYALGLIMYRMVAGKLPFAGTTAMATAFARVHQQPEDLRENTSIPPELAALIMRCLAREPEDRYADIAAVGDELARLCQVIGTVELTIDDRGPRFDSGDSVSSLWDPTSVSSITKKCLAVLPFRYRGPSSEEYVAEALHDDLVDVLSMVRRLEVSTAGSTLSKGDTTRDPRRLGRALGVDALVDGTLQLAGKRARISLRLMDAASGFQLWSERFDAELDDPFDFQDRMSKRLGEALRSSLEDIVHRDRASDEAFDLYNKARRLESKWDWRGPTGATPLYREVIELAPLFKPAHAGYATACMRQWFISPSSAAKDIEHEAKEAVARALEQAPDLAESHLARAMLAVQCGEFPIAASALELALELAPTYAEVHEYLGLLQLDAGRAEQAREHLELAYFLEPSLLRCLMELARCRALEGDFDGADELATQFVRAVGRSDTPGILVLIRIGAWARDRARIERALSLLDTDTASPYARSFRLIGDLLLLREPSELEAGTEMLVSHGTSPRMETFLLQIAAEVAGYHGQHTLALRYVSRAAQLVLVDLNWLDRCPLFDELREQPEFLEIRREIRSRAEAIWACD